MKNKHKLFTIFTVVALLLSNSPIVVDANRASNDKIKYSRNGFSMSDIESKTEEFLLERASIVNFDNIITYNFSSFYEPMSRDDQEGSLREAIGEYAVMLESVNLHYINPRISLEYTGVNEISETKVELQAMETILMEIEGHGTDRGYGVEHNFIYQKIDGVWKLVEDQILSPYGMLKDEKANNFISVDSSYYNSAKYVNENMPIDVSELYSNGEPESSSIERTSVIAESPKDKETRAGYNYTAIATYAETWWNRYNPAYRSFSQDCTNFVSQALRAGGWQDVFGFYTSSSAWWYNSQNQTYSWAETEHFAAFALNSGRTSYYNDVWMLRVGDVLQYRNAGSQQKNHTMVVSYYSNGMPYLTYHSSNTYRKPLSELLAALPSASYFPHRT